MRRKDREITDKNELKKIMAKCDTCRLAMFDEEYPYIVPLNFGVDEEDGQMYLYFHCATQGKKLDLIRKNPKVTFEMDCEHNIILYEERMSCTMGYASIIGRGEVEFVSDEEKIPALELIVKHYHPEGFRFDTRMAKVTTVFRVKVKDMTGKRRNNVHPEEKTKMHVTLE